MLQDILAFITIAFPIASSVFQARGFCFLGGLVGIYLPNLNKPLFSLALDMIKKVRLQNFFSFEDETIELHPEANVFVGINGSGKSNVMKAFKLLQEGMAGRLRQLIYDQWGGFEAIRNKHSEADYPIRLTFELDRSLLKLIDLPDHYTLNYQLEIVGLGNTRNYYVNEYLFGYHADKGMIQILRMIQGSGIVRSYDFNTLKGNEYLIESRDQQELFLPQIFGPQGLPEILAAFKLLSQAQVYDFFDTTPSSKLRKPVIATSEKRLSQGGSNLTQMLNTIKINDKGSYHKILERLRSVNDQYSGIDFNLIGGNIELMLEEAKFKSSVHVTHVSDGTLRYLCLMAIFYNENRGAFICIDEPELGLHPDMIKSIRNAIEESSNKTQYLIATHSDHLLDLFELENIRVIEKNDSNISKVKSLDLKKFEGWYDTFSPGNMWRLGDFGGNRY